MAGHSAIADAGETLVELLVDRMDDLLDRGDVSLASPADSGGQNPPRLTVYLYKVRPSGHLRNDPPTGTPPDAFRETPLALDLYYLLSAHPVTSENATTGMGGQHSVLGRAMQVFHDNAIVDGSDLRGSLAGEEKIHVSPVSMDQEVMDEVVTIWSTFPNEAYQPSVAYVVGPVKIDSERETGGRRVVERRQEQYLAGPDTGASDR